MNKLRDERQIAAEATNDGTWTIYNVFKEEKSLIFNSLHILTITCILCSEPADFCDTSSPLLATCAADSCSNPLKLYFRYDMNGLRLL